MYEHFMIVKFYCQNCKGYHETFFCELNSCPYYYYCNSLDEHRMWRETIDRKACL